MGRVIKRDVVAFRCELRSCDAFQLIVPVPVSDCFDRRDRRLSELIVKGWGLVLTAQMRSYCPRHAHHVWACTCRTNPDRVHLCTQHSQDAAELVWWPNEAKTGEYERSLFDTERMAA